jgi:hypothetical protein
MIWNYVFLLHGIMHCLAFDRCLGTIGLSVEGDVGRGGLAILFDFLFFLEWGAQ